MRSGTGGWQRRSRWRKRIARISTLDPAQYSSLHRHKGNAHFDIVPCRAQSDSSREASDARPDDYDPQWADLRGLIMRPTLSGG